MTLDFRGRSVLKIIIERHLFDLMQESDPKAENLMIKIWHGKESAKCDGDMLGYSCLSHLLARKPKNISGQKTGMMQKITNFFEPNYNVDYRFQFKYRTKAVSFYFLKEFICALTMLSIFQYINYQYLLNFDRTVIYDVWEANYNYTTGVINEETGTAYEKPELTEEEYID
jgi:hypothetical protein